MLEDQVKILDMKVFEAGMKISQAENNKHNVIEELRLSQARMKTMKQENTNLESMIDCHTRENQRLMFELKKYSKGKVVK